MRRRRRGFTLVEVVVAAMVLAITVVAASAVFPLSHFLQDRSGGYSRAATLLQRKLEQVKMVDPAQLSYSGLRGAGVIDAGTPGGTYTFTTCDQVAGQLLQGQGTMTVTGSGSDLVRIDVAVTWTGSRGMANRCSAMTYIADKSVWREP
jgi:prepilin-type N-terminal cleavage/methylation domain-containing protein